MACIQRLDAQEKRAIDRAVLHQGGMILPRPFLRAQLREWYRRRWEYLLREYEKVLPHVEELPDEIVATAVRRYLDDEAKLPPR